MSAATRTYVKGHGTGNDFLLVADPDGVAPLDVAEVVAVADRHTGIGADGVIRAVRSAVDPEAVAQSGPTEWFMDYVNADGSVAEMCGNGIRVFVAFLEHEGLLALGDGETTMIATRAGSLAVRKEGEEYAVDMGPWHAPGGQEALTEGFDVTVAVAGLGDPRPGLRLALPNPHTVIALADAAELASADLSGAPRVEPTPEHGTNVELVVPLGEREVEVVDDAGAVIGTDKIGALQMRVYERGVGETLSCGTGACAAAIATRAWFGEGAPDEWVVLVPGGQLTVRMLADGHTELTGPAELVGRVEPLHA